MANTKANVSTGKPKIAGGIYRAATGSTLPTDAASTLDAAFKAVGYISEDGLTNSNSMNATDIKAWGGDIVYTSHADQTDTFQFTMIEALNDEVLKAYFGDDNVSGALATGLTVTVNKKDLTDHAWVVDMVLNGNTAKRIVIPDGCVTERGDVVYVDDDVIGYNVTITAYPDSSGNTHYEYLKTASST